MDKSTYSIPYIGTQAFNDGAKVSGCEVFHCPWGDELHAMLVYPDGSRGIVHLDTCYSAHLPYEPQPFAKHIAYISI